MAYIGRVPYKYPSLRPIAPRPYRPYPGLGGTATFNVHYNLAAWTSSTFTMGQRCSSGGNAYQCITAGSSTAAPTGTSSSINNGGAAVFRWLSAIDFTSLAAWANTLPTILAFNYVVLLWNNGAITTTVNTPFLVINSILTNGYYILITCAPGESIRDHYGPLAWNASNGVAFQAPSSGTETGGQYFYIGVDNVIFDGLQYQDLNSTATTGGFTMNGNNGVVRNCIIDSYIQFFTNTANVQVYNSLIINRYTTSSQGSWPFKFDINATAGRVDSCTFIGQNVTGGVAPGVMTLGPAGQVTVRNCAFFGFPNPVYCQNNAGSITIDHCCTDVSTFGSSTSGWATNDLGNEQVSKVIGNQFVSTTTDFRLKIGADCRANGAVDLTDVPAGDDIFRQVRGSTWDIGAFQYPAVSGEVDASAGISGSLGVLTGLAGEIDAAAAILGSPTRVTFAAGEMDASASIGATPALWAAAGAAANASASVTGQDAVAVQLAAQANAAAAIGAAAILNAVLQGEIDARAAIVGNTLRVTYAGAALNAAAGFSAYANVNAQLHGEVDASAGVIGNPLRVTFAGATLAATASISSAPNIWAVLRGEADAVAAISATITSGTPSLIGETDAAAGISGSLAVLVPLRAESDATAGVSARATAWLTLSGLFPAAASVLGNPMRVTYAAGEMDAAGGISAAPNYWLTLRGETDAAAGISSRTTGVTNWQAGGVLAASAGVSAQPAFALSASGLLPGSASTTAVPALWAASGALSAATAGNVANALRVAPLAALAAATGGIAGTIASLIPLGGELAAQAALVPGSVALHVGLAGEIDAVGLVSARGNLIATLRGELDAVGSIDIRAGNAYDLAGRMDATAGISIGWQQIAFAVSWLSPHPRSGVAGPKVRGAMLPPINRGGVV